MVIRIETRYYDDDTGELLRESTERYKDEEFAMLIDEAIAYKEYREDKEYEFTEQQEKEIKEKFFRGLA